MLALVEPYTFCNLPTENCMQQLLLQTVYQCNESTETANERSVYNCDLKPSQQQQLTKQLLAKILVEICEDCLRMATLPQGAFAACKVREMKNREQGLIIARMKAANDKYDAKNVYENKKLMEYSPVKYNEKLMNSIWGQYNRYSPHNIKTNEYESAANGYYLQQHYAVAAYAVAENLAMALRSGKEWCFGENWIPFYDSHHGTQHWLNA